MNKIPKVYLASLLAFILPFCLFISMQIWFPNALNFISGNLVHLLLVFIVTFLGFYISFSSFKIKKGYYSGVSFIIALALFSFSFVHFLHAVAAPNFSNSSDVVFSIMDDYAMFLMSLVFSLLIIPWQILGKITFRLKSIFFLLVTVFIILLFLSLFAFPSFTSSLQLTLPYIINSTGLIFFFTAIILMFKYRLNSDHLLFYLIISLFVFSNPGIIMAFFAYIDASFWFFYFTNFLGFLFVLLGVKRIIRKEVYENLSINIPIQNRLVTWLITFILATSIIPLVFVQFIIFNQNKSNMHDNVISDLYFLVSYQKNHILTFLELFEDRIIDLSSDDLLIDYFEKIIDASEDDNYVDLLSDYLTLNKLPISHDLIGINVFSLDGEIIASTSKSKIPKTSLNDQYFRKASLLEYGHTLIGDIEKNNQFNSNVIIVSAPLFSVKTGLRIGVITNYYSIEGLQTILDSPSSLDLSSINTTGTFSVVDTFVDSLDLYLVNSNKLMISNSSTYGSEAILRQLVNTDPTNNCVSYNNQSAGSWRDYRGIAVFGASVCIDQVGWSLIAEIDESQVDEGLFVLRDIMFFIIFLTIIPVLFFGFYFSHKIINPLEILTLSARKISAGNFNLRANISSKSEIKILADAFNQMTDGFVDLNRRLEEKSSELASTLSKLSEQNDDLVNTKRAILNILDDLNEEKAVIENEKSKAQAILSSIADAVFVVDNSSNIILMNDVAQSISGYSFEKANGAHYSKIFKLINEKNPSSPYPEFTKVVIQTGKSQTMLEHTSLIKKSGKELPISYSAAPVKDENDKVIGCVVVFTDFSRERDLERTKNEFLSVAAHQLRTPLSSMRWNMEMLLSGDMGELGDEVHSTIEQVYDGNQRMIVLVNDLLNVSRIDQGRVKTNPQLSNIASLIQSIVDELSPDIKQKSITILFNVDSDDTLPEVLIDPSHVHEVFENLLSNAIKYSRFGGEISIKIVYSNPFIQVSISDNGIGIPSEEQGSIFSKFFRAENVTKTDIQGSGLGLFVVKSFVEAWGGTVQFASEKDKGTTFIVTIPLKPKQGSLGRNLK